MVAQIAKLPLRLLIAVGSRHDRVCSIGAFARAEAHALENVFQTVDVLEPNEADEYPVHAGRAYPDVVFFHSPALHDRKWPWNALLSAAKLRLAFPKALFISAVHEYSEAPKHWRARQAMILKLSHGAIVNSAPDLAGAQPWNKNILRSHLGPTLFWPEINENTLSLMRAQARGRITREFGIEENQKWVLHPGLLTPGKGVDTIARLAAAFEGAQLIVVGGQGPKPRDREFAARTTHELSTLLSGRFHHIDSPVDSIFRDLLLAANLVVLPYDIGLSERRSSFLSAMSCAANVWTTVGAFTPVMQIERSGVHAVPLEQWGAMQAPAGASFPAASNAVLGSIRAALNEPTPQITARRLSNLAWARVRSWERRADAITDFISSLI